MRCKACHYSLQNLTEPRCPECGRAFVPNDPSTFELDGRSWCALFARRLSKYIALLCIAGFVTVVLLQLVNPDEFVKHVTATLMMLALVVVGPLGIVWFVGRISGRL